MVSAGEQVVLVTGANGGIGAALVAGYLQIGATVIASDRGASKLDPSTPYYDLDVTDEAGTAAMIADVVAKYGRIDALVHAAAVLGDTVDPLETSTEEFARVININLIGTFTIVRETAHAMLERGTKGTILLFSSVAAKEARSTYLPYNASKVGVLHITWSMAKMLGPSGITVNAIAPGPTKTPQWEQLAEASGEGPEAAARAWAKRAAELPLRRFVEPDEVARAAFFLTDPQSRAITGICLDVAAGAHLGMGS